MSEGPTVVGSIVANLKIDDSDYNQKLDRAKAAARQLSTVDPTIKVDAKVDNAIAKIEAVRLAQQKLDAATQQTQIAYQRLDEIQTKGGASQSRLMAGHLAATRAENAQERATRDLAAAQAALGAAEDEETTSAVRQDSVHRQGLQRWQMIAIAIAALIPLLAPLAGYALGVAGALAGMGAAGVLAIYGIVQAVKQANATGQQYSTGLRSLKSDLDGLGNTAATGFLSSFQIAVAMLNRAMPALNSQVGNFSQMLGFVGNSVLAGVIRALSVLNPLFVQAGQYVMQLADGFLQWTQNGGLAKFAAYASQNLPQVAETLGSLLSVVMHLVEAASQIGGPLLTAVKGIADALNALPVDVVAALGVTAGATFLAIASWNRLVPVINGVSTAMGGMKVQGAGLMGVIVGTAAAVDALMLAGTAAAGKGFTSFLGSSRDVNGWSDAIRKGNIDVSNLGITAQKTGGFWNDFMRNIDLTGTAIRPFYDNAKDLDSALAQASPKDMVKAYEQLEKIMFKNGKTVEDVANLYPAATAAYAANKAAVEAAAVAQSESARILGLQQGEYETLAQKISGATDEAKLWKDALDMLNGTQQSVEATTIALAQDFQTAAETIASNIKTTDKATATSLDINTKYGVQNHQMILQAVQDAEARAQAQIQADLNAGKSQSDATAAGNALLASSKQSIIDHMVQAGLDRQAVSDLVNQLLAVPKSIESKVNVDTSPARTQILNLQAMINGLTGRTIPIYVSAQQGTPLHIGAFADGGTIGMSTGGSVRGPGSASSDTAGMYRLANGEEVTSNKLGQADRWRSVLKMINADAKPAAIIQKIAGGSSSSQSSVSTSTVTNAPVNNWNISGFGAAEIARQIKFTQWAEGLA